jgi:hypothetical protein
MGKRLKEETGTKNKKKRHSQPQNADKRRFGKKEKKKQEKKM